MGMRDLASNIKILRTISPVAVGTTGTGKTGKPRDRAGYDGVTIEFNYGSITATNAAFTATVHDQRDGSARVLSDRGRSCDALAHAAAVSVALLIDAEGPSASAESKDSATAQTNTAPDEGHPPA